MAAVLAALIAATNAPAASDLPPLPADLHGQRIAKCKQIWSTVAPWSYSDKLASFLVCEHERQGIPEEWFYSLVYGHSGSGLQAGMTYSGGGMTARGLMDCTEPHLSKAEALLRFRTTDLHDPWLSIATHVRQAAGLHRATGRYGMSLLRAVFLPARPDGSRAYLEQDRRWTPRAKQFNGALQPLYLRQTAWEVAHKARR